MYTHIYIYIFTCRKPRKGARPVPGPTIRIGVAGAFGSRSSWPPASWPKSGTTTCTCAEYRRGVNNGGGGGEHDALGPKPQSLAQAPAVSSAAIYAFDLRDLDIYT